MDIVLPKNSLTMTEAEIIEWYVSEGGETIAGEPLFLMETEKSQVVVDATASGRLVEIRYGAGSQAAAGDVIAVVDTGLADVSFAASVSAGRSFAPAAAELAGQLGIDIGTVQGSGPGGRVIEEDVLKATKDVAAAGAAAPAPAGSAPRPAAKPIPAPAGSVSAQPASHPAALSKARSTGNRSTIWAAGVPTFHLAVTVRLPSAGRSDSATVSDLLVTAAAIAARRVPIANAFVDANGDVRLYDEIRVGLLARNGDALVPLVFSDPDHGDLGEQHARRREWMARLGNGALPEEATHWPTIVVSNLGRQAVRWFTAVLFPETALTIAVGGVGGPGPNQAEIVLACDHRVLDGVDAADFAAAFAEALDSL